MTAQKSRPARLISSRWFVLAVLLLAFGAELAVFRVAYPEAILVHRASWRPTPEDKSELLKLYGETVRESGHNLSQRNLYRLSEVLRSFEEPDKAVDVEVLLLTQVPDDRGLRYKVANELFRLGRHQEAEAHYRILAETAGQGE